MIEFKNLHDRFLMHQAFMAAAAAAAAINFNSSSTSNSSADNLDISSLSSSSSTSSSNAMIAAAAFLNSQLQFQQQRDEDYSTSLSSYSNSSPTLFQSSSSISSSPNLSSPNQNNPKKTLLAKSRTGLSRDSDDDESDEEIDLDDDINGLGSTSSINNRKHPLNDYDLNDSKRFKASDQHNHQHQQSFFPHHHHKRKYSQSTEDTLLQTENHKRHSPCLTASSHGRKASSFLISDILGLDTSVTETTVPSHQEEINSNEKLIQQYQNTLKHSYYSAFINATAGLASNSSAGLPTMLTDFQRNVVTNSGLLLSNNETKVTATNKLKQETPAVSPIQIVAPTQFESRKQPISSAATPTSPISNKLPVTNTESTSITKPAKSSILSSLEQLTRNQFQDEICIKTKCLNSSSAQSKKSESTKKTETDSIKSVDQDVKNEKTTKANLNAAALPAWVFCTRYSDRPSAGPRHRKKSKTKHVTSNNQTTATINNNNSNIKVKTESLTQPQATTSSSSSSSSSSSISKTDNININGSNKSANNNNLSCSSSSSSNSSFSYSPSLSSNKSSSSHAQQQQQKLIAKNTMAAETLLSSSSSSFICNRDKLETDLKSEAKQNSSDYENQDNESERIQDFMDDDDDDDSNSSSSKRPRTAFTSSQLNRLKNEFEKCKYLTGEKRQYLANELNLNESQIKIWFQNKRAKQKKSSGVKNNLALQLMAQGLYNHTAGANNPSDD